jgi:hypothetical protein
MQATKKIKICLELEENEAHWLKGVMQNPLHGEDPQDEDLEQQEHRKDLFNSLDITLRGDQRRNL